MTYGDMAAHCVEQQRVQKRDDAFVTFVVHRRSSNSGKVRLFSHGGPMGEVLQTSDNGAVVGGWEANKVLGWLLKKMAPGS